MKIQHLISIMLVVMFSAVFPATSHGSDRGRDLLVMTSTNDAHNNAMVVFKLNGSRLTLVGTQLTGGAGGASGNAGAVRFTHDFGAVVNYGSNTVTQFERDGNQLRISNYISLSRGCTGPDSVYLNRSQMFVVGVNCAESHWWPQGSVDGRVVSLTDSSAATIVGGQTWAAVTMTSGKVIQLPLTQAGALTGTSTSITLPSDANNTPLGAAFWGDTLAFDPAHSSDSFALIDANRTVYPVLGPQPPYPSNAPCWLAKGPGNIWYSGNTPGQAISIFFSDTQGGAFYKSVALPGQPTDITVSDDDQWLAVIYTASDGSGARVALYSIDAYGDLTPQATSDAIGITAFSGVAISQ